MEQKKFVKFGGWLWAFMASVFLFLLALIGLYIYDTDKLTKYNQQVSADYIVYSVEVFLICFLLGKILFLLLERKKDTPQSITYNLYFIAAIGFFGFLRWVTNFWDDTFKFDYKIILIFLFVIVWSEYLKWSKRVDVYFNYVVPQNEEAEIIEEEIPTEEDNLIIE